MQRLTKFLGEECMCNARCEVDECGACQHFGYVIDKLGAYEDSGLDPEDAKKIADFMRLFPKLGEKYILKDKNAPLTIEELNAMCNDDLTSGHIWVKEILDEYDSIVLACIIDRIDDGIVAVYGANGPNEWFYERDYGTKWVAYLEKPEE